MPGRLLQRNGLLVLLLLILFSVAHVYYLGIYDGATIFKDIYFNFVSTFIILFLIILFFARNRLRKQIILNIRKTDIAILSFTIYIVAQAFFLKTDYTDKFGSFFMVLIFYFVFRTIFSVSRYSLLQKSILTILLFTGLVQCLIGVLQLLNFARSLNPYFKLTGSFNNPGPYAVYLTSILPFSLCISLFLKPQTQFDNLIKYLSVSYCIIASTILVFTDSRTAWISSLFSLSVILICYKKFRSYLAKMVDSWMKKIILIIAILSSSVLAYQYKKDSANGRLFVWGLCEKLVSVRPIFGYGFNSFSRVYMNTQADYFAAHSDRVDQIKLADKVNFAFNDYIQICVELGSVGLFLFFLIICSLYDRGVFTIKAESGFEQVILISSVSSLVSILVSCCTSYSLECLPILLNLFLFIAIISGQSKNGNSLYRFKTHIHHLFLFLLFILGFYFLIWQSRLFGSQGEDFAGEILLGKRDYEGAIKVFRSTSKLKYYDQYALGAYAKALSLSKKFAESNGIVEMALEKASDPFLLTTEGDNYKGLKDYANAEKCYTYAMFMIPNRLYPRYLLAKLYFEKGDITRAITAANQILNIKEKVASMDTWYMKEELKDLLKQSNKSQ